MGTAFAPTAFVPGQTPYSSSELNKLGQGIAGAMPVGAIISSFVLQPGFVALDGSLLSRATYDALFAWADANDLIGAGKPFGDGDGATTFRAPDFGGRLLIGADGTRPAGTVGGSDTHNHDNPDTSSAGSHSHTQASTGSTGNHSHSNPNTSAAGTHDHDQATTNPAGSHAHTNPSTGSAGSHSHGSTGGPSSTVPGTGGGLDFPSPSHTHSTSSASSHSHSVGNTGANGTHSHGLGATDTAGNHSHGQGNTGSGGSHSHSNPDTAAVSAHQHAQQPTDDADHLPPWGAVVWQIRF